MGGLGVLEFGVLGLRFLGVHVVLGKAVFLGVFEGLGAFPSCTEFGTIGGGWGFS